MTWIIWEKATKYFIWASQDFGTHGKETTKPFSFQNEARCTVPPPPVFRAIINAFNAFLVLLVSAD